jgi:hypothetical protein
MPSKRQVKDIQDKLNAIRETPSEPTVKKQRRIGPVRWIEENLLLRPKEGGLKPFKLNKAQKEVAAKVVKLRKQGKPIRFIILKSRQLGMSTFIEAILLHKLHHTANIEGQVVAHVKATALSVFNITKRYWRNMPESEKKPLKGDMVFKGSLEYDHPHNSSFSVVTAENESAGRGLTLQLIHLSEMAFYRDQEAVIGSVANTVGDNIGEVYIESTANGPGNLFKNMWDAAKAGKNEYTPIFLSWRDYPENTMEIAPGEDFILDPKEKEFTDEYGLTPEQVKWARYQRENKCGGSWDLFHQEYPVTDKVAFLFSGTPVFDAKVLTELQDEAKRNEPVFVGDIEFVSSQSTACRLEPNPYGPLQIFEDPIPGETYYIGSDPAGGIGGDYSEVIVLRGNIEDSRPNRLVAHFRNNQIKSIDFGVKCYQLGAYYNWGLLGIEKNAMGEATLGVVYRGLPDYPQITSYPNLYYHTRTDRKTQEETQELGFSTSRKTKGAAISRLVQLLSDNNIDIWSKGLLLQLEGFTFDTQRQRYIQNYKDPITGEPNDDGIMALAIANEMRFHNFGQGWCPKINRAAW